jgi:hypothetical protein
MAAWEEDLLAEKRADGGGGEGKFHLLGYPADAAYINLLHDWALQASPTRASPSTAPGPNTTPATSAPTQGEKLPPHWGEEKHWMRENTPLIKKAARELGAKRRGAIRTLKELGFDFEAWRQENEALRGRGGGGEEGEGNGAVI